MAKNIYDIEAVTLKGEEIILEQYRGKILIFVNTASKCGFAGQYAELEELYRKKIFQAFSEDGSNGTSLNLL